MKFSGLSVPNSVTALADPGTNPAGLALSATGYPFSTLAPHTFDVLTVALLTPINDPTGVIAVRLQKNGVNVPLATVTFIQGSPGAIAAQFPPEIYGTVPLVPDLMNITVIASGTTPDPAALTATLTRSP